MKEVIYEVVISTLILILVLLAINLARADIEIVQNLAQKNDEFQKISTDDFISIERNTVLGGDVISFIRYFSNNFDVTVEVTVGGSTKLYIDETYNSAQFNISYEKEFDNQVIYNGSKLEKIICTEK